MTPANLDSSPHGNPSEELLHFTNRDSERDTYSRLLDLHTGVSLPAIMFYGVGGSGKTWLLKKLKREAGSDLPTAYFSLDPNLGGTTSIDLALRLFHIRSGLGSNIFCPRFDLAYTWLRYKQGASNEPCFKGAGFLGLVWELLIEVGNAALSDIPGNNLITWAFKKISKPTAEWVGGGRWKQRLLSKIGQADFVRLMHRSPDEIYPELNARLLADLSESLPERDGKQARAVLFLDSMESLRTPRDSDTRLQDVQQWVRDLHNPNSPLLLVLGGQDQLTWADEYGSPYAADRVLEQHLVGGLSESDSRQFLSNCGIERPDLQDAVLRVSEDVETDAPGEEMGYHAFSLGLCADTIVSSWNQKVAVDADSFDMAPGDTLKLARRFLRSFGTDRTYESWLTELALPPRFDQPAARAALGGQPGTEQDAAWTTLVSYSFVQPTGEPGWYRLHAKMRDALEEIFRATSGQANDPDSSPWKQSHRRWRTRWQQRSDNDCDSLAALAWYHHWSLDPEEALDQWHTLAERERAALRMQTHADLIDWWDPIALDAFLTDPQANQISASALNSWGVELCRATLGNRPNNLNRAIQRYQAALRVRTESDFPLDWAMTQNNLGNAYQILPSGDWTQSLTNAIQCYQAALRVRTEADFPQVWAVTQNNLGLAYWDLPSGDRMQNLTLAIQCYQAALRVSTEADFPQNWAMTQNNLGIAYGTQARLEQQPDEPCHPAWRKAEQCFRDAILAYARCGDEHGAPVAQENLAKLLDEMPDD